MAEKLQTCLSCYQVEGCEVKRPVFTHGGDDLFPDETTGNPQECFLHVCGEGWIAALNRIRLAKRNNETGLLPFGTVDHKPFISTTVLTGRFVAWKAKGFNNGDIVILSSSRGYMKTTNIFTARP